MTREEQIKKQVDIYTDDSSNYAEWSDDGGWSETNDIELIEKAFIEGAKWADKYPNNKGLVNIEIVCEWLSDNMKNYAAFDSDIIKDLKKAMEE